MGEQIPLWALQTRTLPATSDEKSQACETPRLRRYLPYVALAVVLMALGLTIRPEWIQERYKQMIPSQSFIESDGADLAGLCRQGGRPWNPKVIAECPHSAGGIGNIRLNLLNCIRWTIEAKVMLKLSMVTPRNASDLSDFSSQNFVTNEYLIDEKHMIRSLRKHCPEMVVYPANYTEGRHIGLINPVVDLKLAGTLGPGLVEYFTMPTMLQQWPPALDRWIESMSEPTETVMFGLKETYFNWPVGHDPPAFVRQFSDLVRPREDMIRLATAALQSMRKLGTHVDFPGRDRHDKAFIGVHLRVEKDASDYSFLSYEAQAEYIKGRLQEADSDLPNLNKTVIYVASGDLDGIRRLAGDLAPATVLTKYDLLLEGTPVGNEVRALTWDQQALVDMQILQRSGYFFGSRDSSFSWYIALKRAAAVNWVVGGYPRYCWLDYKGNARRAGCEGLLTDVENWRDDLSTLIGGQGSQSHLAPQFAIMTWP